MSDTTEMTPEQRKAQRVAERSERRASAVKDTGTTRCVLYLDPTTQARLLLLAQTSGRSVEEEATSAVEQFVKAPTQAKAISAAKAAAKAKIDADRAAADADFVRRLDLIENL